MSECEYVSEKLEVSGSSCVWLRRGFAGLLISPRTLPLIPCMVEKSNFLKPAVTACQMPSLSPSAGSAAFVFWFFHLREGVLCNITTAQVTASHAQDPRGSEGQEWEKKKGLRV